MKKLSHYQNRILDNLLPPLEKTNPLNELYRICKLYKAIESDQDSFVMGKFKVSVESNLERHLKTKEQFYNCNYFKDQYKELLKYYILDNIDSTEVDFVEAYIVSQQEIIDKKFKFSIQVDDDTLELTQFVQKDFFDEFIRSSKKKIAFLNSLSTVKKNTTEINYDNPYPEYFNSYGYEIYKDFTSTIKKEIILAKMSFLVDQLKKDGLMNSDKSLINIFNFLIEKFDTNFGTATKFKSDYSTKPYLPLYQEIKKRYDAVSS